MKSGMILIFALWGTCAAEARSESLRAMIQTVEFEQESLHEAVIEALPESEEITFYNTEWLRLRQRKQWSVAEIPVTIRPAPEKKEAKTILAIR